MMSKIFEVLKLWDWLRYSERAQCMKTMKNAYLPKIRILLPFDVEVHVLALLCMLQWPL